MKHPYLTVVAIYGHNDGGCAIPAIVESMAQLPGSKGLLLSLSQPQNLPHTIKWRKIFPMNYRQYSLFVMFCLNRFIETDYCLTVQDDGWVLNGESWDDQFLNFDYLGAPCHAAIVNEKLITGYQWVNQPNARVIQNGGFSLRSKKYLDAAGSAGALYQFSDAEVLWNEDVQLTGIWRSHLESLGIRFAPDAIAKQFSIEFLGPKLHDDLDFRRLFGFHGQNRKLVGPKRIRYTSSQEEALRIFREQDVIRFLQERGYDIEFSGMNVSRTP